MSLRIDQLLAGYADGDAISEEARLIREMLRAHGMASEIFAPRRYTSPSVQSDCLDPADYQPGDVLIHHYAIGSEVVDLFVRTPARKVLIYHNITPAEYFRPYDRRVTERLDSARRQLPELARKVDATWAVSEYNATELRGVGIAPVEVFPLLFDPARLTGPDDPEIIRRMTPRLTTILSVGRIAPHKRIEKLIRAFDYYHRGINPFSRLVMVGSGRTCPRYANALAMLVSDLDVSNVFFEEFAAPSSLPTYYRNADLFVSVSDHEGYCLPLLEAMYHGVPVLAHRIGGVPEAMGRAGCGYEDLNPSELAVLMDVMIGDAKVRECVLASQRARIEEVRARRMDQELMALLNLE